MLATSMYEEALTTGLDKDISKEVLKDILNFLLIKHPKLKLVDIALAFKFNRYSDEPVKHYNKLTTLYFNEVIRNWETTKTEIIKGTYGKPKIDYRNHPDYRGDRYY